MDKPSDMTPADPAADPLVDTAGNGAGSRAPADAKSPGSALAQARRGRRLEVVRIASELRLKPATIDALERDDYAQLPSAVFVAGYIRSYARLLDLDAEPLIERFRALHPDAEAPPPRVVAEAKDRLDKPASSAPLLVAMLLALAIGGGYFWWVGHREATTAADLSSATIAAEDDAPDSQTDAVAMPGRPPSDEPLDRTGAPAADLTGLTGNQLGEQAADQTGDLTAEGTEGLADRQATDLGIGQSDSDIGATDSARLGDGSDAVGDDQQAGDLPQPAALTQSIDDATNLAADLLAAESTAQTDSEASPGPAAQTGSEVKIRFSGPCWVDIRDAAGEVQLFGEMADGDSHVLGGEPPYSLVIGNASATEILIGGRPFDVRAVAKGNVARFELDPVALQQAEADRDATRAAADAD
jgi:cytoskeleton protein RodZ